MKREACAEAAPASDDAPLVTFDFSPVTTEYMIAPEQIEHYIREGLACEHVAVSGDGHHFEAVIVSEAFRGRSRVQQHQLVYGALGERMRAEIHALSMKTLTPDEWAGRGR